MAQPDHVAAACSPVLNEDAERVEPGIALCLSGGGYRAMLFHVGALWRLNELGYLPKLDRVSSVSGGSITAGTLGMNWHNLAFDANGLATNFDEQFVQPVRSLASKTIDLGAVIRGLLLPGTISDRVAGAYRKHVFGKLTLQDLPDRPRFVINSTNIQTGSLWRFSKPYMADYQVGMVRNPKVELAVAVAASSAFPPILSPVQLSVDPASFDPAERGPLHVPPYTSDVVLADGGVYDNLGLETAWKRYTTILVSDGGGKMGPQPKPKHDWARHAYRTLGVIDTQVRNLRKRQVVAGYLSGDRQGTYWGIRSHIGDYGPPAGSLPCPDASALRLAQTATRLKAMDGTLQEQLINWGYAICDAGMRKWVEPDAPAPTGFPYPAVGVG
ncbi:MAG: patatin-like phospholipase family protein [Gaiellaceae bacterium]